MPIAATLTARRVRATLATSTRFVRGLVPATIAANSVVSMAVSFTTALACTIAGISTVTCAVAYATALVPAPVAAQSGVAVALRAVTSFAPAPIAGASVVGIRLQRAGYVWVTSGADTSVASNGDRFVFVQIS